jgi:CelD/BcsL family acetyltransferase involved in cellulose biosynthesis
MAPLPGAVDARTSVEIIDQLPGFEALQPQWNELLRASQADGPFLTWEWLHAWWTNLRGQSRLKLFVVRVGEQLVAIAPLLVTRSRLPWCSSLGFLGTGNAGSDYLDLIVRTGFEVEAVQALATSIESQRRALRLKHVPSCSLASRLARLLERSGWTCRATPGGVCPSIRLAGHTWDSYLASRGPAHRANVRRRIRAVGRAFDVRFERVTSTALRLDALTKLATFHEGRWGGNTGSTAFETADLQAFHRDATGRAFDADWLRLYALYLDGQMAGVMYAFAYDHRFYFYQHGFDEQYRTYSLGVLLMALTIRAAIDEGAIEFDLLWGIESYKWLWADDSRPLSHLDLFPAHLGGRMHRRRVDVESALRTLARRMRLRDGRVA